MNSSKVKLSICICTYNRLEYLRLTVFRIIEQLSEISFEIIFVDGGSTDGTIDFLEKIKKDKSFNIKIIKQDKLIGATKSYYSGFEKSNGKYIFPLPDHTIIYGEPFIESLNLLDNNKDVAGVIQKLRAIGNQKRNPYNIFNNKLDYFHLGEQIIYRK